VGSSLGGGAAGASRLLVNISLEPATSVDVLLAKLAANQHGVVTVSQLRAVGIDPSAIAYRVRNGRLHRIHRGVYAVGHARLSNEGRWMAAVLAYGGDAVLSHRSAAQLWRLLTPRKGPIDVIVPGRGGRDKRRGIRLHRSTTLTQPQTTRRANIPVTTPARTLEDLRGCATPDELSRARRQAEYLGYRVEEVERKPVELSRSELERRFLRLCARHHLPPPQVNTPLLGYEVDFLWPLAKLVAETDGYDGHSGRESFEYDRRREARLAAAGYEVLRFTWRQVLEHPEEVVAALRTRLMPPLPSRS
jgi:very-short-patch-repair endonuclease